MILLIAIVVLLLHAKIHHAVLRRQAQGVQGRDDRPREAVPQIADLLGGAITKRHEANFLASPLLLGLSRRNAFTPA
jgi:hypothetical protein